MKPHRTDGVSLVFGLIFLAVAGWWLVAQTMHLALPAIGWFVAGGLIVFGMLGLLGALRSARTPPSPLPATGPTSAVPTSGPPTSGPPASGPLGAESRATGSPVGEAPGTPGSGISDSETWGFGTSDPGAPSSR
jgi:hypothetical protein